MFDLNIPMASLWVAFTTSDFIGKLIVVGQLIFSVAVWSVMVGKRHDLKNIYRSANYFRSLFSSSPTSLDLYFQRKRGDNPLVMVYTKTCEKVVRLLSTGNGVAPASMSIEGKKMTAGQFALVKAAAEETLSQQLIAVDSKMVLIAIGASITPLVGLFGTVLGILTAFQEMGAKGSALLSDVAPGLSSALLTTVVGLIVAIPSAAGYNFLLERIRKISSAMDGFTDELLARLTVEFHDNED